MKFSDQYNSSDSQIVVVKQHKLIQPDLRTGLPRNARGNLLNTPNSPTTNNQGDLEITKQPINYLEQISANFDIANRLITLGVSFAGQNFTVSSSPTLIIPKSKFPRAYAFVNKGLNFTTPTSSNAVTIFPAAAYAAGVNASAFFQVDGAQPAKFWLSITGAGGTLAIDLLTQDPVSGNNAVAATDIFSGANAVGTYYYNGGTNGIDNIIGLRATVTGAAITFAVSMLQPLTSTSIGPPIYIGPRDVNGTFGFPLFPQTIQKFFLLDNVELYAIIDSPTTNQTLNVFNLQ